MVIRYFWRAMVMRNVDFIERMLLGLVAYRTGKTVEYEGIAGKVTNWVGRISVSAWPFLFVH